MSKKGNNSINVLVALLAGAIIGVALGMLYAPEKGKTTRKKLKRKAEDLKHQAEKEYKKAYEKIKDQYQNLSEKTKSNLDKVIYNVKETYDRYKGQVVDKTNEIAKDIESELDGLK